MSIDSRDETVNSKASAWDHIGSLFWEVGRTTAKPSQHEIGMFLAGVDAQARCVVVGASTKDLVESLIARGARVIVLDFSKRMCRDLRAALPPGSCEVELADITRPLARHLLGSADFVLSDRLVNRFSGAEALAGLCGMASLLTPGGQIRTSVKLGLYPMDYRMISLGRERGELERFYDAEQKIIDFSAAGNVLTHAVLPHGDIDRALLLNWYRGRGREQRFEHEDVLRLFAQVRVAGATARVISSDVLPDSPESRMYVAAV